MNYIDIHTHSCYHDEAVTLVVNTFPEEEEKLKLPVYLSLGLHPWHVHEDTWEAKLEKIHQAISGPNIIAIGETGLDKAVENNYELQQQAFLAQLAIAESYQKPTIIHCVRSYSEMLAYRKKSDHSLPWIFHWFNANARIASELIEKNCFLSFGHMLFNNQSKAFQAFRTIPLDHVFFETDDSGCSISEVYLKAAAIRNIEIADLKIQIMNNFRRCFQL